MTADLRYPDLEVYIKTSELDALTAILDPSCLCPYGRDRIRSTALDLSCTVKALKSFFALGPIRNLPASG